MSLAALRNPLTLQRKIPAIKPSRMHSGTPSV